MVKHSKGNTFVKEKTGSATMVNLDGQWEHNFADDKPSPGQRKNNPEKPVRKR